MAVTGNRTTRPRSRKGTTVAAKAKTPGEGRIRAATYSSRKSKIPGKMEAIIRSSGGRGKSYFFWLYKADPFQIIDLIKRGVDASEAKQMLALTKRPLSYTLDALDLPQSTFNRKAKNEEALTQAESERFVGFAKLIGQVEAMVEESGEPDQFDAPAWVARWLEEPLAALGGERPLDLLDTMEGQALVSATLARVQSGAYA